MNVTLTEKTTVYLSKRGRKEFKKAANKLGKERKKIIASLHDLDKVNNHDNRYDKIERLAQLDAIETQLDEKREILRLAKPLPTKQPNHSVAIGSEVELIDRTGDHFIYKLVDGVEADPSRGRVSIKSPLGRVLMGKKPFETFQWPGLHKRKMQLLRIS